MLRRSHLLLRMAVAAGLAFALAGSAVHIAQAAQPTPLQQDGPVADLDGVEFATIQIEAVGTFEDPAEGMERNAAGYGSGFIIDPSGIAVTNNHVVTGGALFRVYVSGRQDPVNARVLGVSECSDLAVIDLQGSGYPYLQWYTGPVHFGIDVYAAGFPLGDPEIALTRGIISKAEANGETSWASLDSVIMHDAKINPGNSGGPLVTKDGEVIGVNYASDSEADQSFAIPVSIARDVVEQLRKGVDVESLGINGEAFSDDSIAGIWVYSVASGSPADVAGVKAGDIVKSIEGVDVGVDGTLSDYCDIVASHDESDVMTIEVLRDGKLLEGQLNGRPLETTFTLNDEEETPPAPNNTTNTSDEQEPTYTTIGDKAHVFTVDVPEEWRDVEERDWMQDDTAVGKTLIAASDVQEWFDHYDVPGVRISYSDSLQDSYTVDEMLDSLSIGDDCTFVERADLPNGGFYTGAVDRYKECAGGDTNAIVAVLLPETKDYIVRIDAYAVTPSDIKALDHVLDTFYVAAGSAPVQEDVGGDIFNIVQTDGLQYTYTFFNGPYFSALLPNKWTDVSTADWIGDDDEVLGKEMFIAPSIAAFTKTWDAPGIQVNLGMNPPDDLDPISMLDGSAYAEDCTFDETVPYTHTIYGITYVGGYEVYDKCGGTKSTLYSSIFTEQNRDHVFVIDFVAAREADDEAFETMLNSFFLGSALQAQVNSDEYVPVVDESGRISFSAPRAWKDNASETGNTEDGPGVKLTVSTDVTDFEKSWETPGARVIVIDVEGGVDVDGVLDELTLKDECTYDARYDVDLDRFSGRYDMWNECGDVKGEKYAVFLLVPKGDDTFAVALEVSMPTDADQAALDPILNTLNVLPPTAGGGTPPSEGAGTDDSASDHSASVTVTTDKLNVRSGPGTNYPVITTLVNGDMVHATGQWSNCKWIHVEAADGDEGWLSGDASLSTLSVPCGDLPAMQAPPAPSANSGNSGNTGSSGRAASSTQGCMSFKNQVGIEINITLTHTTGWNTTFTLGKGQTDQRCGPPGHYTWTASTWDGRSLNDVLDVGAGETYSVDLNPG